MASFHPIAQVLIAPADDEMLSETLQTTAMNAIVNSIRAQVFEWIQQVTQSAILTVVPLSERLLRRAQYGEDMTLKFLIYNSHEALIPAETMFRTGHQETDIYRHMSTHLLNGLRPTTIHCNNDHSICLCAHNNVTYLHKLITEYHILPVLSAHIGKNVWVELTNDGQIFLQYGNVNNIHMPVYRIMQHSLVLRYYPEGLPSNLLNEQKNALILYGLWH
jgi:hypothetical protein